MILVLEASTSAAKGMLYDSTLGVVRQTVRPYSAATEVGTRDCDGVLSAVLAAGREAANGALVDAIAIVGTWHSIVALDDDMRPITPAYSWEYTASDETAHTIRSDASLGHNLYHRTGCVPHCTYGAYTLLHQKRRGLNLNILKFASQSGYIFYNLTGQFTETACTASGAGLIELTTRDYDPEIMALIGTTPAQFARLATYRDTSPLTKSAAALLSQRPGTPVVPAHPDGAMNQLGVGGAVPGIMTLSVGTSAALRMMTARPSTGDAYGPWCYAAHDGWIVGAATAGAGNCIQWFKRDVLRDALTFEQLEAEPENEPPLFLPFLFGERCPGWRADRRGGFHNLLGDTDAQALYYAVQEGICFNLRQCYELLNDCGQIPNKILLSGGILASARWSQMLQDILGHTLHVCASDQASLLGGAALALCATGELDRPESFPSDPGAPLPPNPDRSSHYARRYNEYLSCYRA